MKKRLLQAVTLLSLIIIMFGGSGCMTEEEYLQIVKSAEAVMRESSAEIAEKTTELLSMKYGCDFEAVTIGNRLNKDTADVVLYPDFDDSLTFKAVINTTTYEYEDDFVDRAVGREYSVDLIQGLEDKGLTSFAVAVLYSDSTEEETDYRISAADFAEKYHLNKIHFYWMLDGSCVTRDTAALITDACRELAEKYHCNVSVSGFVIDSSFQRCEEEIALNVSVSETSFRDYDVGAKFLFAYIDGKLNVDAATIQAEIEGK